MMRRPDVMDSRFPSETQNDRLEKRLLGADRERVESQLKYKQTISYDFETRSGAAKELASRYTKSKFHDTYITIYKVYV